MHPRGQGVIFGVAGPGLSVGASPVADPAAQNPLPSLLAPTVEMLLVQVG